MPKVLSIEIGTKQTRIAELDYQSKKPRVYRYLTLPTPEGAIRDGYLADDKITPLAEALHAALAQKKVRTKRAVFTIFSGRIINREIILPGVKPHQINAVINANVTEYFPIELEDYKITHMLLKTFREGENAGKHKVLVLAAEHTLLAGYEKLAEEAGLRMVDIDYAGNGVWQASRHNIGAEPAMIVRIEAENAIISIIRQGELILQRNINFARGAVGTVGLTKDDMIQSLAGTMQRVMDFYASNNEDNRISQVYLMGGATEDEELLPAMSLDLGMTCRLLDDLKGVAVHKNAEDIPMNLYAAAIGSALSSVGFANEKEKERNETNYVNASVLMIIFIGVSALAMLSLSLIPYNAALLEKKSLEKKQEELAPAKEVHDQYVNDLALQEQITYGNALTEHFNDGIITFLEELENVMPTDVEMTDFSSDDEQCVMTMRVSDKEKAAGIIKNLREFDSLDSVVVESIIEEEADETSEETSINFTVTCTYKQEQLIEPAAAAQSTETSETTTVE